jgi:DNA-nicking Smr family endonuclease
MFMVGTKRRANIAGERPSREAASRPAVDADEAALFREATRGVRPLANDRSPPPRGKPPARARFTRADRTAILEESLEAPPDEASAATGETVTFARAAVQDAVVRKLRRGHYRIQAELDLHGLTVREAKAVLREFLAEGLELRLTCVRIIHGKGLRSGPRGPVLKSTVSVILQRTAGVLAFVSARAVDGGTGALYVLLSSRSR